MTDRVLQTTHRAWVEQPHDYELALVFAQQLVRYKSISAQEIARLLAGRPLDLRHVLMLHAADSVGFWGLVDGVGFKITVARWESEGWSILKHYGDHPVVDDNSMGPNPPHPTQILVETRVPSGKRWRQAWRILNHVREHESEVDYEDIYDAVLLACNICDGRVRPLDLSEED